MVTVVTAKSGTLLREYALKNHDKDGVVIFPEYGLSPSEQADYMYSEGHKYSEIITYSPFIISDAKKLVILDTKHHNFKFGDSVNTITMNLGTKETIGTLGINLIEESQSKVEKATNEQDIKDIIKYVDRNIGDCIEKVFFIQFASSKLATLKSETK